MTARAFVLGFPIGHSRSPAMHDAAFAALGIAAKMQPLAVRPEQLADEIARLRALPMLGASVTVPHKLAVAALCDELHGAALAIGAVNCLELRDGMLVGHNTDAAGFIDALVATGFDARGKRAALLGAGGAARAVEHALVTTGAIVDVIARRPDDVSWAPARSWSELEHALATADVVVDCTPTGLDPAADVAFAESLPFAALAPHALVATLVYHRRTRLLELAAARGHTTLDGRLMLIHQAAHAFALWTGRQPPIDIMTRAFDSFM